MRRPERVRALGRLEERRHIARAIGGDGLRLGIPSARHVLGGLGEGRTSSTECSRDDEQHCPWWHGRTP